MPPGVSGPTQVDSMSLPPRHLLAALALAPGVAFAQNGPVAADPEFVVPRFDRNSIPGVPIADADVKNTVRAGIFLQFQRNPVTGYRLDVEIGQIVVNRLVAQAGVSWDFAEWGSLRAVLPVNVNWDTEIPDYAADGAGLGDVTAGVQFLPLRTRHVNVGIFGDVWLPTGRAPAYMGESSVRGQGGVSILGKVGFGQAVTLDISGAAAVVGRAVTATSNDFDLGPELYLSEGMRLRLGFLPVDVALTQALIGRGGFTNFFQGGAENGLEIYGGVQVPFRDVAYNTDLVLDVMGGRGATQGYGTTDFRVLAGLTLSRNPGKKPVPEIVRIERPQPVLPPPVVEEEPPPDAVVVRREDRIEIRQPIEFFVNTADIKPESMSVVQAVAEIMNSDARIKHVVIEGHASAEAEHAYNYDLSKMRAESIYKALILEGVGSDRMSYKGYGEVRPKVPGDGEEAWAVNRRVEFKIVAQYPAETIEWPVYGPTEPLPWSGEPVPVTTPPSPDQIEEQKLRELYEKQKAAVPSVEDETIEIEGGAEAPPSTESSPSAEPPPSGAEAQPEATPAPPPPAPERRKKQRDNLDDATFETTDDEDVEVEGGTP